MPEGEQREQEIENLFEQIIKENSPQSGKGHRLQGSPESASVPKKLDPRKHTPMHIIITLAKIKDKERILKVATEKETVTYKGVPIRLDYQLISRKKTCRQEGAAKKYSKS